jgi:hypoxanthine phosphoribosyltransferase
MAQKRPIQFNWNQIRILVEKAARRIPRDRYQFLYGVPKNGLIIADWLHEMTGIPVKRVDRGNLSRMKPGTVLVVDDLVDSGSTLKPYQKMGHDTLVLYNKHGKVDVTFPGKRMPHGTWIGLPWEKHERNFRTTAIRMLEHLGHQVNTPDLDAKIHSMMLHLRRWKPAQARQSRATPATIRPVRNMRRQNRL